MDSKSMTPRHHATLSSLHLFISLPLFLWAITLIINLPIKLSSLKTNKMNFINFIFILSPGTACVGLNPQSRNQNDVFINYVYLSQKHKC
jgi:hypothetical protein